VTEAETPRGVHEDRRDMHDEPGGRSPRCPAEPSEGTANDAAVVAPRKKDARAVASFMLSFLLFVSTARDEESAKPRERSRSKRPWSGVKR
jgi:hypothetical protein